MTATPHVLPTLWLCNTSSWGGEAPRPAGVIAGSQAELLFSVRTRPTRSGFCGRPTARPSRTRHRRLHRSACAAWDGNGTWDGFIAWSWEGTDSARRLVAVNYAGTQGQCYVRLPFSGLAGGPIRLKDLTGPARYDRDRSDDMPLWGYDVFEVTAA